MISGYSAYLAANSSGFCIVSDGLQISVSVSLDNKVLPSMARKIRCRLNCFLVEKVTDCRMTDFETLIFQSGLKSLIISLGRMPRNSKSLNAAG